MTFDRRSFLLTSATLSAGLALEACKKDPPTDAAPDDKVALKKRIGPPAAMLDTLAAVSERILPSDELGPGAKEAGVRGFLEKTLADERLAHLVPLLKRASAFLDRAAKAEHGKASFAALPVEAQDDLLQRLGANKMRPNGFQGATFLRIMVALTLEGFLGHPRHGGNQGEVAWQWLGYSEQGRAHGHKAGKGT